MTANQGEYATPTIALVAYAATMARPGRRPLRSAISTRIEQAVTYVALA